MLIFKKARNRNEEALGDGVFDRNVLEAFWVVDGRTPSSKMPGKAGNGRRLVDGC